MRKRRLSISIFRRFSLFLSSLTSFIVKLLIIPFNLHFQEIFFVSKWDGKRNIVYIDTFQSPFSGDFLCFQTLTKSISHLSYTLSISIFRRFSLFQQRRLSVVLKECELSISIFRRFSLFLVVVEVVNDEIVILSISIFRRFSLFHDRQLDRK